MTARRAPKLGPLFDVIAYRPNGVELVREPHAFATSETLRHAAGAMVARCRNERGFTPTIRCYRTDRDVTPWNVSDVTAVMLGAGW